MFSFFRNKKQPELTDEEVIVGLQNNDQAIERRFYLSCRQYFKDRHSGVFVFKEGARDEQDLFQDSFVMLWQEIQTRQIYVRDNYAWRIDSNGNNRKMTASLNTYLLSIAKNRNHEIIREEEPYVPGNNISADKEDSGYEESSSEWIVDMCVDALPPRCKNILTLFYYERKTLDEILEIRNENQSKDGLKTGKSKCMRLLKDRILSEFRRRNLKPYCHVQR